MRVAVYELDPGTWQPVGEVARVAKLSIEHGCDDDVPLLATASIEVASAWSGGWCRIEAVGDGGREVLGTFLFSPESTDLDGGSLVTKAKGKSVLSIPNARSIPDGSYVAAGADGCAYVAQMLAGCPGVSHASTFAVPAAVVHGKDCTALRAAWQVLDAAGWRMRLEGDGTVALEPLPMSPTSVVDRSSVLDGASAEEGKVTVSRRPVGSVMDVATVALPELGAQGSMRLMSRSIEVGAGLVAKDELEVMHAGRR